MHIINVECVVIFTMRVTLYALIKQWTTLEYWEQFNQNNETMLTPKFTKG